MANPNQYPLPNPGLPLGQQAVSPVAQTNPLEALAKGGAVGYGMGLQAKQLQIQQQLADQQEQQRQAAIYAAQIQQQKNEEDFVTNAWAKIADLKNVPAYQEHLIKSIDPVTQKVLSRYGIQADFGHEDFVNNDPAQKQVQAIMSDPNLKWDEKATAIQAVHLKYPSQTDLGNSINDMSGQLMKNKTNDFEQKKNIQGLEKDARAQIDMVRGDTNYQKLEAQRNGAGGVYNLLRSNQDAKGNYNLTKQQLVDLNSKLYTALNGQAPTAEALKDLAGSNYVSLYSELAAKAGLARNALPKEIGDRLLEMSDQAGSFAEAQHASMLSGRLAQIPTALPENIKQKVLNDTSTRGRTFQEMKAMSDKASKYQPQAKVFKSESDAEKAGLPKGTIVVINGRRAQIN